MGVEGYVTEDDGSLCYGGVGWAFARDGSSDGGLSGGSGTGDPANLIAVGETKPGSA